MNPRGQPSATGIGTTNSPFLSKMLPSCNSIKKACCAPQSNENLQDRAASRVKERRIANENWNCSVLSTEKDGLAEAQ